MVRSIDDNVGRIIEHLEKEGLRENTLVIFTSDNGFNELQGSGSSLRGGKGDIYEGGIRVPAVFNMPGSIAAGESSVPISAIDYFPTFLELAQVDNYQGVVDGDSLISLLKGNKVKDDILTEDRPIFWHINTHYKGVTPNTTVRRGDWKLIEYLLDGQVELYNLKQDNAETTNVALNNPVVAAQLRSLLHDWRKANAVPLPPASILDH